MPSNPKVLIKGGLYEITSRTEAGLPFVPTRTMKKILRGQLAAAASKYGIRPVAWDYMANHLHMAVIVDVPSDLPLFVAYIKRESAHAVNRLLGRTQHTVWKDDYDPVLILDAEKAIERLKYFFLNPARANLVESIDDYPGFSSWVNGFQTKFTLTEDYVARDTIPALESSSLTDQEDLRLVHQLAEKSKKQYSVEIDCLDWMECFEETRGGDREAMAKRIRDAVYEEERKLSEKRKHPVIGRNSLRRQSMKKEHKPKKIGKRMLCMGSDIDRRRQVINWFKSLFAEREEKRKLLSPKEFLNYVFPGFFRPGNYMQANLNPIFVPF